jgi:hypothetical protein
VRFRLLARHTDWVAGASISELCRDDGTRRFVATIRGFENWRLWEGQRANDALVHEIIAKVREIRDRIDAGDEAVFALPMPLVDGDARGD